MATTHNEGVYRQVASGTKPGGVDTPDVLHIPEGVYDLTIYAVGSAAASCKIEESPSSAEAINTGTPTPIWRQVDASLDSVGTAMVRYNLTHTPVALRAVSLTNNETATLILVGKRGA